MKKLKFSKIQIIKILKECDAGREITDIFRESGISRATYHNLKKKYSGMYVSQLKRLKELEEKNHRLKRMYADLSLENEMLKDCHWKKVLKPCEEKEKAATDIRRISHNMTPGLLAKYCLIETLKDLFEQLYAMQGMPELMKAINEQSRLDEKVEIMLYRIIHEMVNNKLNHADKGQGKAG